MLAVGSYGVVVNCCFSMWQHQHRCAENKNSSFLRPIFIPLVANEHPIAKTSNKLAKKCRFSTTKSLYVRNDRSYNERHMGFRLVPVSVTLSDLELLYYLHYMLRLPESAVST